MSLAVASLLSTGVFGAATHQSAEPVRVTASEPTQPSDADADLDIDAFPTTTEAPLPSTTAPPATTTTTLPPAPKPALSIGADGLYQIDFDAWKAKLLVAGGVSTPSFSNDGARLTYGRGTWGGGDTQLRLSDRDGTNEQLVTSLGHPWFPMWSPSGTYVAGRGMVDLFNRTEEGLERGVVTVATDKAIELPGDEGAAGRWHPTQDRYLYPGGSVSYIHDAANGHTATIPLPSDGPVAWSPDGNRIAVCSGGSVATANADGSSKTTLTNIGSCGPECAECGDGMEWTAAGLLIRNEAEDAIRVDPSTGAKTVLAQNTTAARWSPDGTAAIATYDGDTPVVVIVNADGSNRHLIVRGPGLSKWGNRNKFTALAWSPSGDRLLVATMPPPE
ncbi:MAG: hypothetical protein Q8K63_11905 [Acidimicrobiales bacterium]|nr:hypothetical protein [Acidimicrobiales bacterium]